MGIGVLGGGNENKGTCGNRGFGWGEMRTRGLVGIRVLGGEGGI